MNKFKEVSDDIWEQIPQDMVRASGDGLTKLFRKVIKENGDRFEPDSCGRFLLYNSRNFSKGPK